MGCIKLMKPGDFVYYSDNVFRLQNLDINSYRGYAPFLWRCLILKRNISVYSCFLNTDLAVAKQRKVKI